MEESDEADGQVAQGGRDLWAVAGAQLVAVLIEDHVSDPVKSVLDSPVPLDPGRDDLGPGIGHRQGADQVDHLNMVRRSWTTCAAPGKSTRAGASIALTLRRTRRPRPVSTLETDGALVQGSALSVLRRILWMPRGVRGW